MRLLRLQEDGKYSLVSFDDRKALPSAILSHTWGEDREEVTFQNVKNGTGKAKMGYGTIRFCQSRIVADNLQFFWIDTYSIDKSSSAEAKSINSMYRWYDNSAKCYVYLSDVSITSSGQHNEPSGLLFESALRQSRWFTRD